MAISGSTVTADSTVAWTGSIPSVPLDDNLKGTFLDRMNNALQVLLNEASPSNHADRVTAVQITLATTAAGTSGGDLGSVANPFGPESKKSKKTWRICTRFSPQNWEGILMKKDSITTAAAGENAGLPDTVLEAVQEKILDEMGTDRQAFVSEVDCRDKLLIRVRDAKTGRI